MADYSIVKADEVEDAYADSDVPGEFRSLTEALVRVAPQTVRSHRNEGEEPVEMWAISPANDQDGGEKVEDFWEASPEAAQHR